MNRELSDAQAGFRKGRVTRDQIANICWPQKKQKNPRKTSTSASLTTLKPLTVWITTNSGKFLKRWEYQMTLPASWETLCRSRTGQLERDMEQCTGWKIGKGLCQGYIYCHPACLTYAEYTIRNAALDESKSGLRIVRRSINNLRYADDTTLMTESEKELKSFLIKVNESKKAGLKLNIQKTKITASSPNTSKHRWRKNGNSDRFYFLGLQRKSQTLTAAMN